MTRRTNNIRQIWTALVRYMKVKGTLMKLNSEVVPLSDEDIYRDCLRTLHSQAVIDSHRTKNEFCTKQSPWSFTTRYLAIESLLPWSVNTTLAQLRSGHCRLLNSYKARTHHQQHIRCLSGVWSGTTLRRTSFQLSKPSDTTHSARPMGQPGRGCRLPQPGQLTIGDDLPGYHNNISKVHYT